MFCYSSLVTVNINPHPFRTASGIISPKFPVRLRTVLSLFCPYILPSFRAHPLPLIPRSGDHTAPILFLRQSMILTSKNLLRRNTGSLFHRFLLSIPTVIHFATFPCARDHTSTRHFLRHRSPFIESGTTNEKLLLLIPGHLSRVNVINRI